MSRQLTFAIYCFVFAFGICLGRAYVEHGRGEIVVLERGERCGDAMIQPPEECDEGSLNGYRTSTYCCTRKCELCPGR